MLSYDFERGAVVAKPITEWFDNGVAELFLQFTVERGGGNGRAQFALTENHMVSTPGGWRPAGELCVGDRVMQVAPQLLSDLQWEVALGGLMGDGAFADADPARCPVPLGPRRQADRVRRLEGVAVRQPHLSVVRSTQGRGVPRHAALAELAELRDAVYVGGKKVLVTTTSSSSRRCRSRSGTWMTGHSRPGQGSAGADREGSGRSEICVASFDRHPQRLARPFRRHVGPRGPPAAQGQRQVPFLVFSKDETAKLHALIAPFVHPSMQYKLLAKYRVASGSSRCSPPRDRS